MPGSTEMEDIQLIKNMIFKDLPEKHNILYRDYYFELIKVESTGLYDPSLAILDKWLYKYGYCTIKDFMNIPT